MAYSVTIEVRDEFLRVVVEGDNTLENVLDYMNKAYEACVTNKVRRVLIEERLTGPNLETFDIFEVVIKNFSRALALGLRIAFVDLSTGRSQRGLKFGENLAHIRGVNVRLFNDPAAAAVWLQEEENK